MAETIEKETIHQEPSAEVIVRGEDTNLTAVSLPEKPLTEEEDVIETPPTVKKPKNALPGEILRERKRWGFLGIPWTFTKYILTNKKIVIQYGFFTQVENEILLFRIKDMTLKRTFFQRLFGLGTLTVYADDKTNPTLEIKNIKRVRQFKEALSDAVEKDRLRVNLHPREIVNNSHGYGEDDDIN